MKNCGLIAAAGAMVLLLAVLQLPVLAAPPRKGSVSSIEPASVKQGDAVLLTIKGKDLPTGTVVVEFYPQQIAVIGVLSADEHEITVQVKVPQLAPPGQYNVMIYNQLGDEAFAPALLSIGTTVLSPTFRSFDPKVIAEATNAFAVVLGGDSILPDTVSHLHMDWTLDGAPLPSLLTAFSYSGPATVVCSVSGTIPSGKLRGKVYFDQSPVYQLDLEVAGSTAGIVGHSPAVCHAGPAELKFRLIGTGLKESLLPKYKVSLIDAKLKPVFGKLAVADTATLIASFPPVKEAGDYSLQLESEGAILYTGKVQISAAAKAGLPIEAPTSPVPVPPAEVPTGPAPGPPAVEIPSVPSPPVAEPAVVPSGTSQTDPVAPAGPEMTTPAASVQPANPGIATQAISVTPTVFPSGNEPVRLAVRGLASVAMPVEHVGLHVRIGAVECERVLCASRSDAMLFVFAPPPGGWLPGAEGLITIDNLPGNSFSQAFTVGAAIDAGPATAGSAPAGDPSATLAGGDVSTNGKPAVLDMDGFSLTLLVSGAQLPAAEWAKVSLDSGSLLLKANAGRFDVLAFPRKLGDQNAVELQFHRRKDELSDEAWAAMTAVLLGGAPQHLDLEWPAHNIKASLETGFVQAAASGVEDDAPADATDSKAGAALI